MEGDKEEMPTDISNNDFLKQKRNRPLQNEMSEDERMDDKDSQDDGSETSKESKPQKRHKGQKT